MVVKSSCNMPPALCLRLPGVWQSELWLSHGEVLAGDPLSCGTALIRFD